MAQRKLLANGNAFKRTDDRWCGVVFDVNLSAINRVLNRLEKSAGLEHCTIHGLRHSVASILDDNGVALSDISVLLGHESTQTTEKIYIKRNRTAKISTINVLDQTVKVS